MEEKKFDKLGRTRNQRGVTETHEIELDTINSKRKVKENFLGLAENEKWLRPSKIRTKNWPTCRSEKWLRNLEIETVTTVNNGLQDNDPIEQWNEHTKREARSIDWTKIINTEEVVDVDNDPIEKRDEPTKREVRPKRYSTLGFPGSCWDSKRVVANLVRFNY